MGKGWKGGKGEREWVSMWGEMRASHSQENT